MTSIFSKPPPQLDRRNHTQVFSIGRLYSQSGVPFSGSQFVRDALAHGKWEQMIIRMKMILTASAP